MPHPQIENATPFVAEALHLVDEAFQPVAALVVKATFDIDPGGMLSIAAEQVPLLVGGEFTDPEASESSYRFEPEVAPVKLATDVVLVGHAHAPNTRTTVMDVGLSVGSLVKGLRVYGERMWFRTMGEVGMTEPRPFETMPIVYERAFGGRDTSHPDPSKHGYEPRNPVGRGFHAKRGVPREHVYVANIEDPAHPISSPTDRPPPAGFGFISPDWKPRAGFAGTYDDAWDANRKPLLPEDFDRRHYNAGSPGLVAPGYLKGDESVQTIGLCARGRLGFRLPGLPPPEVRIVFPNLHDARPITNLDTVIIDLDRLKLMMIWRACAAVPEGPHGIKAIVFDSPGASALPRSETIDGPRLAANQGLDRGES